MSDATGFIAEQRHNRRASVFILAGTFALLFIVANLVTGTVIMVTLLARDLTRLFFYLPQCALAFADVC